MSQSTSAAPSDAGRLRPAVFLDRDGVLNEISVVDGVPHPPDCADDCRILPGVPEALERLRSAGYALIVVTNQPDVARGTQRKEEVERINAYLVSKLSVDAVYTCYHDNADQCECRKPKPGMLLQAAQRHGIDLSKSYMVGDRSGDVLAGAAAGCRTLLVDLPHSKGHQCRPDFRVADLLEAADRILTTTAR